MSAPTISGESPSVLVLSRADVRRLLTLKECIAAVEEAFRLYGQGAVQPPAVLGTHVAGGGFHIKAGVMPWDGRLYYAAKTNANFPDNPARRGLPTIQGAVLLFDAECGKPLAVMDSIEITSLRTAAATAVAAKFLAREDSKTLTVIGCGVQGRVQATALLVVRPFTKIFAYDIDPARASAFATELRTQLRIDVEAVEQFPAATRQSDAVITCTTSRKAFLLPEHIRPGTFVAAVGADNEDKQELDPRLLAENVVVPDVVEQAASIGELHHAVRAGTIDVRSITTDLGRVVAGKSPGRTSPEQVIIFDSTGMALQDVAAACAVYDKARSESQALRVKLNE
jgi:alanine dehydrogenase